MLSLKTYHFFNGAKLREVLSQLPCENKEIGIQAPLSKKCTINRPNHVTFRTFICIPRQASKKNFLSISDKGANKVLKLDGFYARVALLARPEPSKQAARELIQRENGKCN